MNDAIQISHLLVCARDDGNLDLISYLGLDRSNWDVVAWIVKTVSEVYSASRSETTREDFESGILWPSDSLTDMTWQKFEVDIAGHGMKTSTKTIEHTFPEESDVPRSVARLLSRGLGQIWRSLGYLILTASTQSTSDSRKIMFHVLAAIATLHHNGIVSDSVYSYSATTHATGLQQPPILHMLSTRILASLSDAAWYAQTASVGKQTPRYGVERYKFLVDELGHEIWLELVLWSCLHGKWVADGAAILTETIETSKWSLISWRSILSSADGDSFDTTIDWAGLRVRMQQKLPMPAADQRHAVVRTLSCEVIAAYVDGLANVISVGGHDHAIPLRDVLDHINIYKHALDRQNMGLGYNTWDALSIRLIESGGFVVDEDPQMLLEILALTQPFGRELESSNLERMSNEQLAYVFDPSAAPLGLLHRAIDAFVDRSDVEGAFEAFRALQRYTDLNKQRSLAAFFRELKQAHGSTGSSALPNFSSNLSVTEYPAFDPQIPNAVLSGLLEMLADARLFQLGDWMIHSDEIDGKMMPSELYKDPLIAAALVRYATSRGDAALLRSVVQAQAELGQLGLNLPDVVLVALLHSQIKHRNWEATEDILKYLTKSSLRPWQVWALCDVAREMLVLQKGIAIEKESEDPASLAYATSIFRNILDPKYGQPMHQSNPRHGLGSLHGIVAVLSSISKDWADFCAHLSPLRGSQPLILKIRMFDTLLDGVVSAFGVQAGKRLWDTWCVPPGKKIAIEAQDLPHKPPSIADNYFDKSARVVLEDMPDGTWVFRNRIKPRLSTIRVILRGVLQERGSFATIPDKPGNRDDAILAWALSMLSAMTRTQADVDKELERIVTAKNWQNKIAAKNI